MLRRLCKWAGCLCITIIIIIIIIIIINNLSVIILFSELIV